MIKELIKKQEITSLAKFVKRTTDYGKHYKVSPEKYAEEISDRMIQALEKNLSQHGIAKNSPDEP